MKALIEKIEDKAMAQYAELSKSKVAEPRKVSMAAAKYIASVFKNAGHKVDMLSTDGWGMTPFVIEAYDLRMPSEVGVQELPKGISMHIQVQSPIGRFDPWPWKEVKDSIETGMKKKAGLFKKYGKVKITPNRQWPTIWLDVEKGKEQEAMKAFPNLAHKAGVAILQQLLKDESSWVDQGE